MQSLIGHFDLDPNRVFDIVCSLSIMISYISNPSYNFFDEFYSFYTFESLVQFCVWLVIYLTGFGVF